MKRIRRFVLLLVSLCLFFNVTLARALNSGTKSLSNKKGSSLQITNLKKSNILLDFDIETVAEEALQEESDSDNIQFNYILFQPFNFSIDAFNFDRKAHSTIGGVTFFYKLPLFIRYQNFRI